MESHARVEYYNGRIVRKERTDIEKDEDEDSRQFI